VPVVAKIATGPTTAKILFLLSTYFS